LISQIMSAAQKPTITIIGLGRLGSALFQVLGAAGYNIVSVVSSRDNLQHFGANDYTCHVRNISALRNIGDLCFLCVPDDVISSAATMLNTAVNLSETTVVHVSGARTSEELHTIKSDCYGIASFHPIQTFTKQCDSEVFSGITISLEGDVNAIEMLIPIVSSLGAKHLILSPSDKTRVHAAAVIVSNFMSSLFLIADDILADTLIDDGSPSHKMFATICRQTLENIINHGLPGAITGPASRGDINTIKKHLDLLSSNSNKQIYKLLSNRIVREFYEPTHPICEILQHTEQ
jgi:predicted short-subunit dehydrogenase-like oxidoreductase (DUF2520 family)